MKKTVAVFSGIVLVLGCLTLGFSLLVSAILPNALLVYLTSTPASFGHDILYPNMTGPYIFSIIEIVVGLLGLFYFGLKTKE